MALVDPYLTLMKQHSASDCHFKTGEQPRYRIDGNLQIHTGDTVLTAEEVSALADELISPEARERFAQMEEIDFSYNSPGLGFFRFSYYCDMAGPALAARRIPERIPTLANLSLPDTLESFAHLRSGLVLVTGPTGCGKSSTLAALINIINNNYNKHIITLEDPIEYVYKSKESIIHQRALRDHFATFEEGLEAAMNEDPDVLLVGELRELESIRLALTAAEAGMLVLTTLHTVGAAQSIDRVYDVYPANEQGEIRTILSQCLAGVISQVLLKRVDQAGRVPATEVLVTTPAVRNLIREGKTIEISNLIQSGKSQGMHTMSESLENLVIAAKVDVEEALTYGGNRDRLEKRLHTTHVSRS